MLNRNLSFSFGHRAFITMSSEPFYSHAASRFQSNKLQAFSDGTKEKIDITYDRLFQIKKDFHDLQKALENISRFGLDQSDLERIEKSNKIPEELKDAACHPSIIAASNLKSAFQEDSLKGYVALLDSQNPNSKIHTTASDYTNLDTSPIPQIFNGMPKLPKIENKKILKVVFTHRSVAHHSKCDVHENNERLEFLGDSVLNHAISILLFTRFPQYQEGKLTDLRAEIVCNKNLTKWSYAYGFHRRMISSLSSDELKIAHKKLYANIFEAYVGGLYLDSNRDFSKLIPWLTSLASPIFDKLSKSQASQQVPDKVDIAESDFKLPKEALYVQLNPVFIPNYEVVEKQDSDHNHFKVVCMVNGEILGMGIARSKKDAGSEAAYFALKRNRKKVGKYIQVKDSVRKGGSLPVKVTKSIEAQLAEGIYDDDVLPHTAS